MLKYIIQCITCCTFALFLIKWFIVLLEIRFRVNGLSQRKELHFELQCPCLSLVWFVICIVCCLSWLVRHQWETVMQKPLPTHHWKSWKKASLYSERFKLLIWFSWRSEETFMKIRIPRGRGNGKGIWIFYNKSESV